MNFQFMIPAVLSATEVVASSCKRAEKFEPEQGLGSVLNQLSYKAN